MALTTITRQNLRQMIAGPRGLRGLPVTGTATDDGTTSVQATNTLVDARNGLGLKDTAFPAERFAPGGILALWGGTTSTTFEWAQLLPAGGYSPSEGKAVVGRTFATTPVTALTPYEIHTHGATPDELHEWIKWSCRNLLVETREVLTGLVADGNMEDSGTTNWTGTNATVTKTTTEANVGRGAQALSVVTTAAAGYAESPSMPVGGSKSYRIFALVKATGGTASIVVRDFTNTAAITVSWGNLASVASASYGDWRFLAGTFTTPATCVNIRLRLQNDTITTTSYFDDVCVYPVDAGFLPLPTWVDDPEAQLVDVVLYRYLGTGRDDYVPSPLRPYYGAFGNPTGQTAYRLAVPLGMIAPIAIVAARGLTEPTADSSTVPDRYAEALLAGSLYQAYQAGARPRGMDAEAFAVERTRVQRDWWGYAATSNPRARRPQPAKTRVPGLYWSRDA